MFENIDSELKQRIDSLIKELEDRIARPFAPGFGLVTATPRVEVRSFPVSVFRHRRNAADPRIDWLCREPLSQLEGAPSGV